ncbi:4'-phosphopantetheinyl transferase [Pseudomonas sp. M47T1]|uniref:4'-phosphopantetheinyl transferase family protein n=1 Tax=unclassified Pseudomonas TaxID=196821 RepID=UPI0002606E9D|nr:4'-phosphopantetheinyl transferase [Pseudomonas sp. M47T1]EIK98309.1 4'-phosphopantetheinyl transferase [Pseudomonas sp. M47T1]
MNPPLACCTAPHAHWPLPFTLPGVVLVSNRFDPKALVPDDFVRAGITPPASIQRSVAKRQAEFLAGRLCARTALQQLAAIDHVPAIGEDRAPLWPPGISGSISHGTGWAGAVVARHSDWQGLGLDMETLLGEERATRLAGEILTPAELARMDPAQASLTVTLTFSIKESLFKALYPIVGKRFYFEHAEVMEWDTSGRARMRLLTDLSQRWCHGVEIEGQFGLHDDHLLSLIAIPHRHDAPV